MTAVSYLVGRRRNRTPGHTVRHDVFTADGFTCQWCHDHAESEAPHRMIRRPLGHLLPVVTDDILTIDHIRPLALGGTNDRDNLMTLCNRCNSLKGTYPFRDAPLAVRWYARAAT